MQALPPPEGQATAGERPAGTGSGAAGSGLIFTLRKYSFKILDR
jgi:hypothetical protein